MSCVLNLLWLIPVVTSLQSCNKDNVIPSYVYIDSITVGGSTAFGSLSSKITDVWVYTNTDSLQGAYQLPARFPIRANGLTSLRIIAGIKVNGIAATRAEYPFYTDTTITVNLVPTKTDTIKPVVAYFNYTVVAFNNNFENGNIFNNMNTVSSPVFEGKYSGEINIPDTATSGTSISPSYVIPKLSPAVFLEMNYMCDDTFTMGLDIYTTGTGVFSPLDIETFAIQPQWNKIYINLTNIIQQYQPDSSKVYFYVNKSNLTAQPHIYFDNIKLLYFNP